MSKLRYSTSISLDGFTAGPDQSVENPIGVGGSELHTWLTQLAAWRQAHGLEGGVENESTKALESDGETGAFLMGRNMFGGGPGPWGSDPWTGWWGSNPPFHLPVFVLTHHPRPPIECEGGTTFFFVTDGIEEALAQAKNAAGDNDVEICGGANIASQYLAAGHLDEFRLNVVPVLLGAGARLFDDAALATVAIEQVSAFEGPGVTHLTYRVIRPAA